jgi:hypothetical protein
VAPTTFQKTVIGDCRHGWCVGFKRELLLLSGLNPSCCHCLTCCSDLCQAQQGQPHQVLCALCKPPDRHSHVLPLQPPLAVAVTRPPSNLLLHASSIHTHLLWCPTHHHPWLLLLLLLLLQPPCIRSSSCCHSRGGFACSPCCFLVVFDTHLMSTSATAVTGTGASMAPGLFSPCPSWPRLLAPHVNSCPSQVRPAVWRSPTDSTAHRLPVFR